MNTEYPVEVALVGCGRIGVMHAELLQTIPTCNLCKIYDADKQAAERCAKVLGLPIEEVCCEQVDSIFSDDKVEAVVVASSADTHCDYIKRAVEVSKAVFCEKPLDLDLTRASLLVAFLSSLTSPPCVQLGFNRRFDPGHRATRDALLAGDIGELYQVVITSRDPALPSFDYLTRSGGIFRDMSIHDLDMARFMLGEEPSEVFAIASALIDKQSMSALNDYDCAMIIIRTPSGLQCHINNACQAPYGYDQRVELLGAKGMLRSENRRALELRRFVKGQTDCAEGLQYFFTERYAESYRLQFKAFFACVIARRADKNKTCEVDANDGFRALLLAEGCYRSLASRSIVSLDDLVEEYQ